MSVTLGFMQKKTTLRIVVIYHYRDFFNVPPTNKHF
jgi:hypothetical protein